MDRCIGHRDITEILLKAALNTVQSINLWGMAVYMTDFKNASLSLTPKYDM